MSSLRNLGFNQRVQTVCSEDLDWASGKVERCIRNRGLGFDGYTPTLNQFRGQKAQIANGVWRLLNMPLTINGVTPIPHTFVGMDAAATGWPERRGEATLAIQSGGGLEYQQPGWSRDGLGYLKCDGVGWFQAGDNNYLDFTTEDIVTEVVLGWSTTSSVRPFGKLIGGIGFGAIEAGGAYRTYLNGTYGATTTITNGALCHIIAVCDKSGSMQHYVNGTAAGAAVDISGVGSISNLATPFMIAHFGSGTKYNNGFYLLSIFNFGLNGLDSHLQPIIAAQRSAALFGWLPLHAKGSDVPNTMSRDCAAYSYRYVGGQKTPFYLGPNAMPWDEHGVDEGLADAIHGPRADPGSINKLLQSSTLATSPWATAGSPTITEGTTDVDDPRATGLYGACKIEGLGAAGATDVHQAITGFAASVDVATGFWLRPVSGASGTLEVRNHAGTAYGQWRVDLSVMPNRWVRITRGSPYLTVVNEFASDGSGNAGLLLCQYSGTVSVYWWNGQQQQYAGLEVTGDIGPTTTAIETRLSDSFQLQADDNIGGANRQRGTWIFRFLVSAGLTRRPLTLTDGGDANERIQPYIDSTGRVYLYTRSSGATKSINVSPGYDDGDHHDCRGTWDEAGGRIFLRVDDETAEDETITIEVPSGLDELDVQQWYNDQQQFGGIMPILLFLAQPSIKG
jgi:hypothetical protein